MQRSLFNIRGELEHALERDYLQGILERLRERLGERFEALDFYVLLGSHLQQDDLDRCDPRRTIVFHASEEYSTVPHELCARSLAVFKAYLPAEGLLPNLFSLPLGYVRSTPYLPPLPIDERRCNVFFSGALRRSRRELYQSLLNPSFLPFPLPHKLLMALRGRGPHRHVLGSSYLAFTRNFMDGLPGPDYAQMLSGSKIVLCPRGAKTPETYRHFEAMRAGAIVISEPLPELEFYVGSPMVIVESWTSLRALLVGLLSDPDALAERQRRTLAWWEERCSEDAVAKKAAAAITRLAAEAGSPL